ncbi:MAG: hypothetical protein FVQ77_17235, partial [Cytophagales bacterium]|nr:hypothetical protein [Cytophagales bacterium]
MFRTLYTAFLLLLAITSSGQTNIAGIINSYTKVTAINSSNSIAVISTAEFSAGDKAFLIQMKGATIDDTSNTSDFGNIISYNNTGNYEFAIIDSINGDTIIFQDTLLRQYDPAGLVQLITLPEFCNNNVNVTGTLTAAPWDGNIGGVLVFETGVVTLNANIDVSGKGFRGGTASINGGFSCDHTDYFYTMASTRSGQKGEGIAIYGISYEAGRGALANGGGGGNEWNAGGGGGGNYGTGGRGGDQQAGCVSLPIGGEGGYNLNYSNSADKIFLGGGGGGGEQNDNQGTPGAGGGGIIIIIADTIVGNGFSIISNGNNVPTAGIDGGGGGGAGGTILLDMQYYISTLNVTVNGGKGGNTTNQGVHGPGGGGGGGIIWISDSILPAGVSVSLNGGLLGLTSNAVPHGAANGSAGNLLTDLDIPGGGLLSVTFCQCAMIMNLNTWAKEGDPALGNWVVSADGESVTQTVNHNNLFFVGSDTNVFNTTIIVQIEPLVFFDDDYIGFVFGYQSPVAANGDSIYDMDFILFDWKNGPQGGSQEGLSLSKIKRNFSADPFTPHINNPPFSVLLASDFGAGKGWNFGITYNFELLYTSNRIRIKINGDTIFDVSGAFQPGRF